MECWSQPLNISFVKCCSFYEELKQAAVGMHRIRRRQAASPSFESLPGKAKCGGEIKSGRRDKCQGALTPPEELDGGLPTTVAVFHITRIVSQVLLLQGAYSQGNGHFLLAKMLLDDPATRGKKTDKQSNDNSGLGS